MPCAIWVKGAQKLNSERSNLGDASSSATPWIPNLDQGPATAAQPVTPKPETTTICSTPDPWSTPGRDPWATPPGKGPALSPATSGQDSRLSDEDHGQIAHNFLIPCVLAGENAKKKGQMRAAAHAAAKAAGVPLPPLVGPLEAYGPHPPICNRTGSPWGQPPMPCSCNVRPAWLQKAPPAATTLLTSVRCHDDTHITREQSVTTVCSYWRPGLKDGKERGYYNGVVHHMFRVNRADGTSVVIIALN